jgi:hypothetical protein
MADEAERLVIAPFRDIIEKGNAAIANAQDADNDKSAPMLKAAQSLVKEGERALKRIEPLCTKNFDEYGLNFIDAVKEHGERACSHFACIYGPHANMTLLDELAQYRAELEDLLWDFDDYVGVDEFDADKFDELQKCSRKTAPRILDIIKRMKLVTPMALSSLPSRTMSLQSKSTSASARGDYDIPANIVVNSPSQSDMLIEDAERQLRDMMGTVAGPDEGLEGIHTSTSATDLHRSHSHRSEDSEDASEPPRPPSADPWQVNHRPPINPRNAAETALPFRAASPREDIPGPLQAHSRSPGDGNAWVDKDDHERRLRAASRSAGAPSDGSVSPSKSARWTNSTQASANSSLNGHAHNLHSKNSSTGLSLSPPNGNDAHGWGGLVINSPAARSPSDASTRFTKPSPSIPEEVLNQMHNRGESLSSTQSLQPKNSQPPKPLPYPKHRPPSIDSVNSSVFDVVDFASNSSPVPPAKRNSIISATPSSPYSPVVLQPPAYPGHHPVHYQHPVFRNNSASGSFSNQSASTLNTGLKSNPSIYDGLIPVQTEGSICEGMTMPMRNSDCTIGPNSSFYKLKGFCKGAEEFRRGGTSFKRIKRPVGVSAQDQRSSS